MSCDFTAYEVCTNFRRGGGRRTGVERLNLDIIPVLYLLVSLPEYSDGYGICGVGGIWQLASGECGGRRVEAKPLAG